MQINFGDNVIVEKSQLGDNNTMIIETTEEHWEKLNTILSSLLNQKDMSDEQRGITHDALKYVKNKDTKGFIAFIKNNKSSFVTNILSNFASTGLLTFLKNLCR